MEEAGAAKTWTIFSSSSLVVAVAEEAVVASTLVAGMVKGKNKSLNTKISLPLLT